MPVTPFLAEMLRVADVKRPLDFLDFLVEFPPEETGIGTLSGVPGIKLGRSALGFFAVNAPLSAVARLERLGVNIHYNAPMRMLIAPSILDPVLGRFSVSNVVAPYSRGENFKRRTAAALKIPASVLGSFGMRTAAPEQPDFHMVPSSETRAIVLDEPEIRLSGTKVAVIDTGLTPVHPQFNPLVSRPFVSTAVLEPPVDMTGHGQHVTTVAFGGAANTKFGKVMGVVTVTGSDLLHVKCLTVNGFGPTSAVLFAIEQAIRWGARVINMSLGGILQGSVEDDPLCKVIARFKDKVIFVVAAGNSGPDPWTIDTPGASPHALTVGAYSPVYKGIASFSSRGPNAAWYKDHVLDFTRETAKYGEDFLKPDCVAPGGGPVDPKDKPDLIYSGLTGWMNGTYDGNPFDLFEGLRGTSMAAPVASGLVALAISRGQVNTAADVKHKLAVSTKDPNQGYGLLTYQTLSR